MDGELFLISDAFDSLRSLILNPAKGSAGAEWSAGPSQNMTVGG